MTELPKVHVPPRLDGPDTTTRLEATKRELEADRARIIGELLAIDTQLADPNRVDPQTGGRLHGDDYWAWRHAAVAAKAHKTRELQEVKALLADARDGIRDQRAAVGFVRPPKSRLEQKVDLLLDHFGIEWVDDRDHADGARSTP